MTTVTNFVPSKDYKLNGILDDELDCIEGLLDKSGYLSDAISETADGQIPIYNNEVWEDVSKISEYVEQAISEGIAPVSGSSVDLIKIFQSGYYVYYEERLYENLDELAFNYVADKVNEAVASLNQETLDAIAWDEVTEVIEGETDSFDAGNTFDDLDEIANKVIESINAGEYVA